MFKFKKDKYASNRGGTSVLLEISCEHCGEHVCYYQKDGPGQLKRMYCDRIVSPPMLVEEVKGKEFNDLKPVKAINPDKLSKEEINKYIKNGEKKIREGKFAVTIMAGGQGTRLGHYGPKGTFKVTINNNEKYLFEIIIEKLLEAKEKYNVIIPCYIMTSSENHDETIHFLKRNELFWISRKFHKMFHTRRFTVIR